MKTDKIIFFLLGLFMISCDPQPCEVEHYILEPIQKKLYVGIPDSTMYFHELLLTEVFFDTEVKYDTTVVDSSIVVTPRIDSVYSCNLSISGNQYELFKGDTISYGNEEAGGTFSVMKLNLDRVNINTESVDLSLWKVRFVQDCSEWN